MASECIRINSATILNLERKKKTPTKGYNTGKPQLVYSQRIDNLHHNFMDAL